jgi:hypothetical protein
MIRFVASAAFLTIAAHAIAAPPENADQRLAPWYQGLKQPGSGVSCCSIADCRQVDYRVAGGHYEALIESRWTLVPDDKVLQHEWNPTGHAVVCYTPWQGILCFVSAAET